MVLIESDWNLKSIVTDLRQEVHTVLIESDWNLKLHNTLYITVNPLVLIESDWNLKYDKFVDVAQGGVQY